MPERSCKHGQTAFALGLACDWSVIAQADYLPWLEKFLSQLHTTSAKARAEVSLQSVINPHYAGGHWLGTFALYLEFDQYPEPHAYVVAQRL